jgi:2-(1,2-epoxy-1,2-dihydrophenyl)acetyl-CoA isomerase
MESRNPADLARALYAALASGDRDQLDALLYPESLRAKNNTMCR